MTAPIGAVIANPELVDRLEREVIDSFKSLTKRGSEVGGILLGAALPVHIMTPSSTVRRIVDMTALAVAGLDLAR